MIPKVYSIDGGSLLRVCHTDKFKAGMLSLSAVLPIRKEQAWMTSLLLSVLRRGTVKYPSLSEINRRLDYLYGTELSIRNFYRGDNQIIGFSVDLLDSTYLPHEENLLYAVLDVMHEILFCPLLDEDGCLLSRYVESEKKQQCDSILALKNNPRGYAAERCRAILYENEPCGASVYGTVDEVMRVTPKQLTDHWHALLDSISFDCFYVGAEPAEKIVDAIKTHFLPSDTSHEPLQKQPSVVLRKAEQVRRAEETLSVAQSQLVIGLRTGTTVTDASYYACALFNELLGVSPVSRLFMNVREKLSLCYFCSSHYNAHKGVLMIHCGLARENRELAEREILKQISEIAHGKFSKKELDAAKKSIVNAYRQLEDSPAALESFYFGRSLAGSPISLEACREAFSRVTRNDVIKAAKGVTLDTVYFLEGILEQEEASEADDD